MCTHNQCFEQKCKKYQNVSNEIFYFYRVKNLCIFHRQVFLMKIRSCSVWIREEYHVWICYKC